MGGGTEAFPDLGKHCQKSDCRQLDFLPFKCDGCHKVFCLDHRSYKTHECPKSEHNSRTVTICSTCSAAIETTGCETEADKNRLLENHSNSGKCDPNNKKKPTCPVRRCKEHLTFSNTSVCKTCRAKVCLNHRFPADHGCAKKLSPATTKAAAAGGGPWNERFLAALASRNGNGCGKSEKKSGGSSVSADKTNPSVKAY